MDLGSQGYGQAEGCIETASATTSAHNEGSLPFALGVASAAIVAASLLVTLFSGCAAQLFDDALATYGDQIFDGHTRTYDPHEEWWYEYDPFGDQVVDEFGPVDEELYRILNDGPRA